MGDIDKSDSGSDNGGSSGGIKKLKAEPKMLWVENRANYPVEIEVRGRWVRWEPRGYANSIQCLTIEEAACEAVKNNSAILAVGGKA